MRVPTRGTAAARLNRPTLLHDLIIVHPGRPRSIADDLVDPGSPLDDPGFPRPEKVLVMFGPAF
jgi:hypothetical protein